MAALLRRAAALVVILGLALLALAGTALADGRDVLADVKDNDRVVGCYTRAEFREAQRLVTENERLYADLPGILEQALITNVARPGQPCGAARVAPRTAVDDDPGHGKGLWIGLALGVGVISTGAAAWARRRGHGDEGA